MAFPNVPFFPGVPPIPRNPLAAAGSATLSLLVADTISAVIAALFGTEWGIFKDGTPVVIADNVLSLDFKRDYSISDYPVEQGGFETYDKVQMPFEARVRFSAGGSEPSRQALLDSVDSIAGSLDLFDVVTPERVYQSVNVHHYDYARKSNTGLGLITIDVWCQEVRVVSTTSFTQSASSANASNSGTVQTTPATSAQSNVTVQ